MQETTNGITRESFEAMPTGSKLNILFDCVVKMQKSMESIERCQRAARIKNTVYASLGGVIGGALAVVIKAYS